MHTLLIISYIGVPLLRSATDYYTEQNTAVCMAV